MDRFKNNGLTNFKGNMPTKSETEIAKNYLSEKELDRFLTITHKDILEGAGKISHEKALERAHQEYDKYMKSHLTQYDT